MVYLGKGGHIPYLDKSKIVSEVNSILDYHWRNAFPVDVEAICDDLDISIIPISGLYRTFSIDAYISSDFRTIFVDEKGFKDDTPRYRFSVAHELGHYALHRQYYPENIKSVAEWLDISHRINSNHAEFQANYFAGSLLVPEGELTSSLNDAFNGSFARNYWSASIAEKEKILIGLKKHFKVSSDVIIRRIRDSFPGIGGNNYG